MPSSIYRHKIKYLSFLSSYFPGALEIVSIIHRVIWTFQNVFTCVQLPTNCKGVKKCFYCSHLFKNVTFISYDFLPHNITICVK